MIIKQIKNDHKLGASFVVFLFPTDFYHLYLQRLGQGNLISNTPDQPAIALIKQREKNLKDDLTGTKPIIF